MPLKLPPIGSGAVQSFAREDVNQPLREAQYKAQIAQQLAGLVKQSVEIKAEHDKSQSNLKVKAQVEQFEIDNAEVEYFDREDLKAQGFDTSKFDTLDGDNTQPIPRDQVYADLYKKKMQDTLKKQAANIQNPRQRQLWMQEKQAVLDENYTRAKIQDLRDQSKRIQAEQELSIQEAVDKNQFAVAKSVANEIVNKEVRGEGKTNIGKAEETHDYEEIIRTEDIDRIDGALEKLREKKYRDKGGRLDDSENITEQNRLEAAKARILKKREGAYARDKSLATDVVKKTTVMAETGVPLDNPSIIDSAIKQGFAAGVTRANMEHLFTAKATYNTSIDMMNESGLERLVKLNQFLKLDSYKGLTPTELDSAKKSMQKAYDDGEKAQRLDNRSWAIKQFDLENTPLNDTNPVDFGSSLQERIPQNKEIEGLTDQDSDYLSIDEAEQFRNKMKTLTAKGQAAYLIAVNESLDQDSYKFYQAADLPGHLEVSAELMQAGDSVTANQILAGQELINNEIISFKNWPEYNAAINEVITDNFNYETPKIKEAIKSAYAYLANEANERDGDMDSSLIEDAIAMVVGNQVTMGDTAFFGNNGYTLVPPERDWTQEKFEGWINNWTKAKIQEGGGQNKYPFPEQLAEDVEQGRIRMIGIGRGEYSFQYTDGARENLLNHNKQLFTIRWSPLDPTEKIEIAGTTKAPPPISMPKRTPAEQKESMLNIEISGYESDKDRINAELRSAVPGSARYEELLAEADVTIANRLKAVNNLGKVKAKIEQPGLVTPSRKKTRGSVGF